MNCCFQRIQYSVLLYRYRLVSAYSFTFVLLGIHVPEAVKNLPQGAMPPEVSVQHHAPLGRA